MQGKWVVTQSFSAFGRHFGRGTALPADHGLTSEYVGRRAAAGFLEFRGGEDAPPANAQEAAEHEEDLHESTDGVPMEQWSKRQLAAYALEKHDVRLDTRRSHENLLAQVRELDPQGDPDE